MDLELRPITEEERIPFVRAISQGFGNITRDDENEWGLDIDLARTLAVFDEDEIVGTAGAYTFAITVPGGAQVPTAGVSVVTVRSTHRRRGLLVAMMDRQLDDVAERGEPIAALTASESLIYGRFGYGSATVHTIWELQTEFAEHLAAPAVGGRLRLVDKVTAPPLVGPVYDDAARRRVGEVTRSPAWWTRVYDTQRREAGMSGDPKFFTVVHEDTAGSVDGFARYVMESSWPDGVPAYTLRVLELHALEPEVEADLWRHLLDADLVEKVVAVDRPLDDPLRWRLVDPRRLVLTRTIDHLWVRIVDVGAAMAARRYTVDDALAFELHDAFRPANSGTWFVEGGPDGAQCTRTDRPPDLVLGAADLGALYLGGVDATTLAHAGRIEERTSGAISRADRFFRHHPSPWCSTHF
jgi:predicted acetyltransferase